MYKKSFPNPILREGFDDYVNDCAFKVEYDNLHMSSKNNIELTCEYTLNCDSLQDLILNDKAQVIIKVRCVLTSFAQLYYFPKDTEKMTIEISSTEVSGTILLEGMIVASVKIDDYHSKEFNKLYFDNIAFNLRKGDVLAKDLTLSVPIDDTELEKPLPSIFKYLKATNENSNYYAASFEGEKIEIYLGEALHSLMAYFESTDNGAYQSFALSMLVMPALVEAVSKMQAACKREEVIKTRWARAITHHAKIHKLEFDDESAIYIANALMNGLVCLTMEGLHGIVESANSGQYNSNEEE